MLLSNVLVRAVEGGAAPPYCHPLLTLLSVSPLCPCPPLALPVLSFPGSAVTSPPKGPSDLHCRPSGVLSLSSVSSPSPGHTLPPGRIRTWLAQPATTQQGCARAPSTSSTNSADFIILCTEEQSGFSVGLQMFTFKVVLKIPLIALISFF